MMAGMTSIGDGSHRVEAYKEHLITETVSIASLVMDWTMYPRNDVSGITVNRFRDAMVAGQTLPPIIVCAKSKRIVDGFHRVEAHKKLQLTEIEVEFRHYENDTQLFLDAVHANVSHGRELDSYDLLRCMAKCEELGIAREEIGRLIHIPTARVDEAMKNVLRDENDTRVPIKRGLSYVKGQMDGKPLSPTQVAAVENYGGSHPTWHARQLLIILESDLWPHEGETFGAVMTGVCAKWNQVKRR